MATSTMREVSAARSTSRDSDRIEKEAHRLSHATTTISLTPEQFEKLYLSPKTPRASQKATRFANAAPLGFMGFVISTFTFSMVLMGWGGASGLPAVVGIFFFTGPLLLILSTIFLWIQAQTFFMLVCGLFSVFWLSFGVIQLPTLGLAAYYSPTGNAAEGAVSEAMNAVIALYLLVWGFALGTFFVFAIRINLIISGIFGFVTVGAWVLSGAYWALSDGKFSKALKLQKAGGAMLFVVAVLGWCLFVAILAAEMRWTCSFPVGDLSHYWASTDVELGERVEEKKE